jgi:hypothetical protein
MQRSRNFGMRLGSTTKSARFEKLDASEIVPFEVQQRKVQSLLFYKKPDSNDSLFDHLFLFMVNLFTGNPHWAGW